jgi:hypothetical protein
MFYFSALGVDWITESPHNGSYDGNLHNHVRIDGRSTPRTTGATGWYLGSVNTPEYAAAAADLKPAYDYTWVQQVMLWDEATWAHKEPLSEQRLEFEDDPRVIAAFKGTQHYKMRNWWPGYVFSNWVPTVRIPYNPVERADRSVALVRGTKPYGIVSDLVRQDDASRLYQWSACVGRGVWLSDYAEVVGGLAENQIVLGFDAEYTHKHHGEARASLVGAAGDPQLLVHVFNRLTPPTATAPLELVVDAGPIDSRTNTPVWSDTILAQHQGAEGRFQVLLLPFRRGEALPSITYDDATATAQLRWADREDVVSFDRSSATLGIDVQLSK